MPPTQSDGAASSGGAEPPWFDRPFETRLRSILAPFDATGSGISMTIEGADGAVLLAAGEAGAAGAGRRSTTVRQEIVVNGQRLGAVVAAGDGRPALIQATAASIAASLVALAEMAAAQRPASNARLEAELALAHRIQRSFIPLIPPDIPGYDVAGHYEAAREVGGDFFDVFRVRGRTGRLAITIADVTGKGIAAALLMAFARPLLHAAVDHAGTPGDALERTNRILVEERRSSLFVTALCAIVELRSGTLHLANAGHEPPLYVPAGDGPIVGLQASGRLLGAFRRLDLEERSIRLAPGDAVVFYTDGVTDAQASGGERFGDDRLTEAVSASRAGTAADIVAAVRDACQRFQGEMPAADDLTIVAIRRRPRDG